MVASAFRLLGASDLSARLPAALGGVLLVALAWLLRERFGRRAAFLAGALVAFSPILLYFTRFCREDIWSLLGTAGGLLFLDAWIRGRRLRDLALSAVAFAVAFAAKENFYVFLALLVPSCAPFLWKEGEGFRPRRRAEELLAFLSEHAVALSGALLVFFAVSELCYTLFLTHPESGNPAVVAIRYWWGQHKVQRVGGPRSYYLPRILQYEFAIVLPALVWAAANLRRMRPAERFLLAWGISSLAMYAWLGEKTPWLIVHQILPFVPLAALGWAELVSRGVTARLTAGAVAAASAASALALSFENPVLSPKRDEAESIVYVQTAPEMLDLVREITASGRTPGEPVVSIDGEAAWPMNWYLRDVAVDWGLPRADHRPAFAIVDPAKADDAAALLGPEYRREELPLRVWWLPETSSSPRTPSPKQLLVYLATRRPWSPIGWQSVTVFRKGATR
jgi:uncharacterized protein (TIGR03663 family)